jgi:hypothetical protein
MIAVIKPRSGVVPEAVAIAMDRGSATMATVIPATRSRRRSWTLYPSRNALISFGVKMLLLDPLVAMLMMQTFSDCYTQ